MSVSMKQIAELCGLSRQTVGFILTGKKAHLFKPETRDKVIEAARSLGYRPHAAAQAMAAGKFSSIGLLCGQKESFSYVHHGLLEAISHALNEHEMHLTVAFLPDEQIIHEGNRPKFLSHDMVDGLLLNYTHNAPKGMDSLLKQSSLPCVWVNAKQKWNAVYPDDFGAACAAVESLCRAGCDPILYYDSESTDLPADAPRSHYSVADRRAGYLEALGKSQRKPILFTSQTIQAAVQTVVQAAREKRRAAVLTYSMIHALHVYGELERSGVRVPEQTIVAAFNADLFNNPDVDDKIRVVRVPQREMGQAAVAMMLALLESGKARIASHAVPYVSLDLGSDHSTQQ